jgi:outer membrane receptor protein involved in Fe transport
LPDKVENTELGIKSTLMNGRMLLNVVAFDVQWKDIQINQSGVDGQWWMRGTLNGGKGQNRGVDISLKWRATENLNIEVTGSFGDPKYTEDIQRLNDVVPAGTSMVWAYKEKISFWADYNIPTDILGGSMWVGYNHTYEGDKWNNLSRAIDQDPEGLVPSHSIANAHVGLDYDNGWSLHLTARNLWDERGINSLWQNNSGELFGDPRFDNMRVYTRPRTFTFSVSKHFE